MEKRLDMNESGTSDTHKEAGWALGGEALNDDALP